MLLCFCLLTSVLFGGLQGATPLEHSLSSLLRNTPEVESHDGLMLPTIPAWGSLLRSWSSLHRQQDCMELLRHLLTENCLPHLQCRWEARPLPGSVAARRPMIRGLISIDLQLPRRTHDTTMQGHNSAGGRGYSAPTGRPSAPSGSPSYTWSCTEDGKPAEVCHPTYSRILSENCYILCFRLDTQPRTVLE